jgi:hypothetical protein
LRGLLDDYMESLTPADLIRTSGQTMTPQEATAILTDARANYRVGSKLGILDEAARRAELSRSASETAIAQQIRRIASNDRLRRMFSEEEQVLLQRIAGGDNSLIGRFINTLAWMAPRGWAVSIPVTGALATGNMLPLVPMGIGTAAHAYRSGQTNRAFQRLQDMAAAELVPPGRVMTPQTLDQAMLSAVWTGMTEDQRRANALRNVPGAAQFMRQ